MPHNLPNTNKVHVPVLTPKVDCSYCNAPCCKLIVELSPEEAEKYESVPWDFGEGEAQHALARRDDGYCVYFVVGSGCYIYDDKPNVCNVYTCENDSRITPSNKYGSSRKL